MGYKIASSKPDIKLGTGDSPTFLHGVLLQWLNPKAWVACVSGVSAFNLTGSYILLAIFVALYFVICYASQIVWALAGDRAALIIDGPGRLKTFNLIMGSSLILVAAYLFYIQL